MTQQVTFGRRGTAPVARPKPLKPLAASPPKAEEEVKEGSSRIPLATLAILALLTCVYILEVAGDPTGDPGRIGRATLVHLGGVSRELVLQDGQVWRLFTAPWMHGGIAHFIGNGIALVLIGLLLEPIVGWRWFTAIYAVCGVAGSIGSLALNATSIVSIGASGAIVGLMACAVMVSFHRAAYGRHRWIWYGCARAGIPALLPSGSTTAVHIDYSCHTGGAFAGFLLGYLLLIAWDGKRIRPPWEPIAAGVAVVVSALGVGVLSVAAALPVSAAVEHTTPGLIPPDKLPTSVADGARRANELAAAYPLDPRAHAIAAARWESNGDGPEAIAELQLALRSPLLHAPEIDPDLETTMRMNLTAQDFIARDQAGARETAAPLCQKSAALAPKWRDALKDMRVCEQDGDARG